MREFRINLTLPGFTSKTPAPPPAPTAAPPPPTSAQAAKQLAPQLAQQGKLSNFNIKNIGGARGLSIASTIRALKGLTGQ